MMANGTQAVVLVGTRKGLWIGRSDADRTEWEWEGPAFNMEEVYSCMVDTRRGTPRLLVGASSSWVGPQVGRELAENRARAHLVNALGLLA